jgi:hypothetical protein
MSNKATSTITRRGVVRSAGIGFAVAAAPSIAKGNSQMAVQELHDPSDKYPKPPYKRLAAMARVGEQDGSAPGSR